MSDKQEGLLIGSAIFMILLGFFVMIAYADHQRTIRCNAAIAAKLDPVTVYGVCK